MLYSGAIYDVIRPFDLAARSRDLWSAGTGDHGFFARWMPGVDSAWLCRCSRRYVVSASHGFTGTLCSTDRHNQLPDSVVHYRLRPVRRSHRIANKTQSLDAHFFSLRHVSAHYVLDRASHSHPGVSMSRVSGDDFGQRSKLPFLSCAS